MDFVDVDETNRQWVSDFTSKQASLPQRLENMDGKCSVRGEGGDPFIMKSVYQRVYISENS